MHDHEIIFAIAVAIGMLMHYCKKNLKQETAVTCVQWFTTSNVKASLCTAFTATLAIIGALSNNLITDDMSLWTVLYVGLTTGYTTDSASNSE